MRAEEAGFLSAHPVRLLSVPGQLGTPPCIGEVSPKRGSEELRNTAQKLDSEAENPEVLSPPQGTCGHWALNSPTWVMFPASALDGENPVCLFKWVGGDWRDGSALCALNTHLQMEAHKCL